MKMKPNRRQKSTLNTFSDISVGELVATCEKVEMTQKQQDRGSCFGVPLSTETFWHFAIFLYFFFWGGGVNFALRTGQEHTNLCFVNSQISRKSPCTPLPQRADI